jgi:CheY-like chemotaxis protein
MTVARVVAFVPDLLFGSRVQAMLLAADHEVELVGDEVGVKKALLARRSAGARVAPELESISVLIVDLTNDDFDGPALVEGLEKDGELGDTRTLGFYAHVDTSVREQAEAAGFDQVVPRSRMAREGVELVARLIDSERA